MNPPQDESDLEQLLVLLSEQQKFSVDDNGQKLAVLHEFISRRLGKLDEVAVAQ
jgi:hypothetical protein